jgi:hypothetical protein
MRVPSDLPYCQKGFWYTTVRYSVLHLWQTGLLRIGSSMAVMEPVVMLPVCILPRLFHKHGVRVDSRGSCTVTVICADMLYCCIKDRNCMVLKFKGFTLPVLKCVLDIIMSQFHPLLIPPSCLSNIDCSVIVFLSSNWIFSKRFFYQNCRFLHFLHPS